MHIIFFFLWQKSSLSHKWRYEGYMILVCRYFSDDIYTELTYKRIPCEEITYIYRKDSCES